MAERTSPSSASLVATRDVAARAADLLRKKSRVAEHVFQAGCRFAGLDLGRIDELARLGVVPRTQLAAGHLDVEGDHDVVVVADEPFPVAGHPSDLDLEAGLLEYLPANRVPQVLARFHAASRQRPAAFVGLLAAPDEEHLPAANDEPGHAAHVGFHSVTLALDNPFVSEAQRATRQRTFRLLLVLGAASSIAVGVWGVFWIDMLERVLGLEISASTPAFDALGRMYGGVMLSLGLGYALAAAQPHRSRSLLVVLFAAPLAIGVVVIAGAARGEIMAGRGAGFAAFNIVYCLLFFRSYPRLEIPPKEEAPPTDYPSPEVT